MERKKTVGQPDERDERAEEQEALRDFERDEAENYGSAMFGKIIEDSPAAEVADAEREER